mgnify:CR=1 FL=1
MQPQRPEKSHLYVWAVCTAFIPVLAWSMWNDGRGGWKALPFFFALFVWFLIRDTREYRRLKHAYPEYQSSLLSDDESAP